MTEKTPQTMADAAEMLWIVLANVSGGNWKEQSPEWQEAAARWRDNYFAVLKAASAVPNPLQAELCDLLVLMPDSQVDELLAFVAQLRAARSAKP